MADITWKWDTKASAFLDDKRIQKALFRAAKRAGSDALRAVRAEAKRQVRARVRLKAGYLAARALPLTFARGGKTLADLEWRMRVSGRAVPLGEYPARQVKRGVSVEVERGKRSIIAKAFIQKAKASKRGVYLRPKGSTRYAMGHRLGLRVSDSMRDGRAPTAALRRGGVVFGQGIERLMRIELEKR